MQGEPCSDCPVREKTQGSVSGPEVLTDMVNSFDSELAEAVEKDLGTYEHKRSGQSAQQKNSANLNTG